MVFGSSSIATDRNCKAKATGVTRRLTSTSRLAVGCIMVLGFWMLGGCQQHKTLHPDVKENVTTALKNNHFDTLNVSEDREKGILTVTGSVPSEGQKAQVESLIHTAAPDYVVADEVGVRPPGAEKDAHKIASDVDQAIEKNFSAMVKGHKDLDDEGIQATAKNGTLVLKGSVKTPKEKNLAGDLAKSVPNVQQVVNELEVNSKKIVTPL